MIVWGGGGDAGDTNTGGKYNPTTNSWTATSTTNAPSARAGHTAVWTGTQMIVWGGVTQNGLVLNTGGRYDPSTDSWTATSTTNAPAGRWVHTAVWADSEMIVWGGLTSRDLVKTGGSYCAATPNATPTPTPSATPTATVTPGPIQLGAQTRRVGGINTVHLAWSRATSPNVDIYRNHVLIATQPNGPGVYIDSTGDTGRAQYRYRVCEAGTQTCSNEVLLRFRGRETTGGASQN